MKSVSDNIKLCTMVALVAAANLFDLASTYAVSPNLAGEWNILERQFGLGWAGLIGAKLVGCWFAYLGYAYYLRHRTECYSPAGASLQDFAHDLTFGAKGAPRPGQWVLLGVNLGYFWAGIQLLVVWVAVDNLLLRYNLYCPLREMSEMGYHLLQSAVVGGGVLARFYLGNYHRYGSLAAPAAEPGRGLTSTGDCANLPAI